MDKLENYAVFLEDYCQLYKEFAALEQEKLALFVSQYYFDLDEFVKREQVMVLKAQGMEEKRIRMHKALDTPAKTLRELIATIEDGALQQRFIDAHQQLNGYVQAMQVSNQRCQEIAKDKLDKLEDMKETMEREGKGVNYSSNIINRSV